MCGFFTANWLFEHASETVSKIDQYVMLLDDKIPSLFLDHPAA